MAEPARVPAVERARVAPRHLRAESRRLWESVTSSYVLEPHHEAILLLACEALDRLRQAQAAISKDGAYISGRFGLKAHPALAVERDSRLAMLRSLREVGLDYSETPPAQRTAAARAARWNK